MVDRAWGLTGTWIAAVVSVACTSHDADPCASLACAPEATCAVADSAASCVCSAGFVDVQGDGSRCVAGCEVANPCAVDATCTTTATGVSCTCSPGFIGDGMTCTDVDECGDGTNDCDANAQCANAPGGFTCTCVPPSFGDGITCETPTTWSVLGGPRVGKRLVVDASADAIYALGSDGFQTDGYRHRLEKRSRETGARTWWTGLDPVEVNDVATDGTTVFVGGMKKEVGYERYRWWIQAFNEGDGSASIQAFVDITAGGDRVRRIAVHGDSIYAFGEIGTARGGYISSGTQLHLTRHLRSSLAITWSVSESFGAFPEPGALAVDDSGVYIAANHSASFGFDAGWLVQKRSLTDGSVIWSHASNPSTQPDYVQAVTVDATGVYIAGSGGGTWRIEKRALDTGAVVWAQTFAEPAWTSGQLPTISDVAADPSGVYVFGDYSPDGTSSDWKVLRLNAVDGSVSWTQVGGTPYGRSPGGITLDAHSVYLLGTEANVYKFEKRHKFNGGL